MLSRIDLQLNSHHALWLVKNRDQINFIPLSAYLGVLNIHKMYFERRNTIFGRVTLRTSNCSHERF